MSSLPSPLLFSCPSRSIPTKDQSLPPASTSCLLRLLSQEPCSVTPSAPFNTPTGVKAEEGVKAARVLNLPPRLPLKGRTDVPDATFLPTSYSQYKCPSSSSKRSRTISLLCSETSNTFPAHRPIPKFSSQAPAPPPHLHIFLSSSQSVPHPRVLPSSYFSTH